MTDEICPVCNNGSKTVGHLTWFHSTSQLAEFIVNGKKSRRDDSVEFIFGGDKSRERLRKEWENDHQV